MAAGVAAVETREGARAEFVVVRGSMLGSAGWAEAVLEDGSTP